MIAGEARKMINVQALARWTYKGRMRKSKHDEYAETVLAEHERSLNCNNYFSSLYRSILSCDHALDTSP
jgi:hypothetical protein